MNAKDSIGERTPRTQSVWAAPSCSKTPVFDASVKHDKSTVISALLEAGLDVNAVNERKRTPLHSASRKGHVSTTLSPLLSHLLWAGPSETKVRAPSTLTHSLPRTRLGHELDDSTQSRLCVCVFQYRHHPHTLHVLRLPARTAEQRLSKQQTAPISPRTSFRIHRHPTPGQSAWPFLRPSRSQKRACSRNFSGP